MDNVTLCAPARMSDGRHFTDYRPSCYVNNLIRLQNIARHYQYPTNGYFLNSYEYRLLLQHKADELIKLNRKYAIQQNSCANPRYYHVDPNSNDQYWNQMKHYLGY